MANRTLPKYKNPPVNEVFLGISFTPLQKMKAAHTGLFWNIVKKEFPKCEHAPVLGNIDEVIEPEIGLLVPRIWLINKEDDNLIQIQKNKFFFNWRKREKNYPHFDDISIMFFENLKKFSDFLSTNDLGSIEPNNFELTYINNIPKGEGWDDIKLIGKLIPDITWNTNEERFLHDPEAITWQAVFNLPDKMGKLIAKLQTAVRRIDNHPLIIFEIAVRGIGSNKTEKGMRDWFSMAHEWIVLSFEDLTANTIQNDVWRKVVNVGNT